MRIEGIAPRDAAEKPPIPKCIAPDKKTPSFKETFASLLRDVNASQKAASDAQKKFLTGEVNDVHQVINKSEEGKVAFNLLVELRNKGLDAFNEIMRLRL